MKEIQTGDIWFNMSGEGSAHGYATNHEHKRFKGDGLAHNGELL